MTILLEARGLVKSFGSVQALRGADFAVPAGEVVALVGDNGAGKSTLVEALSGNLDVDEGEILWEGKAVTVDSPTTARELGIEIVHQDLALAPDLDPAANLYLGREILKPGVLGLLGVLDNKRMAAEASATYATLGVQLQAHGAPIGGMSGGQRQGIAVARSVRWANKLLFLDEPTAALGIVQRAKVLDLIRRVRDNGVAVDIISHNLPEIFEVADRIEVLRLGARVAQINARESSMEEVVSAMTGALKTGEMS